MIERFFTIGKRLILPALFIWLFLWLWLGGLFTKGYDMTRAQFMEWTADQGMVVEDVVIEGRHRTNLADMHDAIGVEQGAPILSIDVEAIQERLSTLPWVKSVSVSRAYNGIISITMAERIPLMLWDRPGRATVVVDTEGTIIEGANMDNHQSLLVVSGVDAPRHAVALIETVMAETDIAKRVRAAEWIGDRRWDVLTTKGVRIHLPADDIGFALSRLARLQDEKNILDRGLLSIDLRAQDRIIIETPRGEARDAMTLSSAQMNSI